MKNTLIPIVLLLAFGEIALCQEKMEIEGAIIIKNSEDASPAPGTIRFNPGTNDFEGWNGVFWASLTGFQLGSVTDVDGNEYGTVFIGTQEWMAENLKTTKYNDNIGILNVTIPLFWSGLNVSQTGAWCYHGNVSSNNSTYGKLYNWYAVNSGKLCPTGLHVPSDAEWTTLTDYLGGLEIAGGKMKETGTTHWYSPNTGATNESGFTGLPGGYRNSSGSLFFNIGNGGVWWSSSQNSTSTISAWYRDLNFNNGVVFRGSINKRFGLSVRCVRD